MRNIYKKHFNNNSGAYQKASAVSLIFLACVAGTMALIYTRSLMIPFIISLLIYTILIPVVRWLRAKLRLPKIIAVSITFIAIVALFTLLIILISNSVNSFISGANIYSEKIASSFAWLTLTANHYGYDLNFGTISTALSNLPVFDMVKGMGRTVLSIITNATLCFIFLMFFFVGSSVKNEDEDSHNSRIIREIQNGISYYMVIKFLVSAVTGIIMWLLLLAFGVELAFIFGLITFILNFIPNVGSIVATILPLPVMFLQFGFGVEFFVVLGLSILTQFVIGSVLEPQIIGDGVDLHPVLVLCSLVFWALVWGIAGAFLAVPLTVVIKIILSNFKQTKQIAELMAGRF